MARKPYNKLLTNLASLSRTAEYWPSVVFVLPTTALALGYLEVNNPRKSDTTELYLRSQKEELFRYVFILQHSD